MKRAIINSCAIVVMFLFSCKKQEIAIEPVNRGDVITAAVDLNSDYKQQIFYSLYNNSIVSSNLKTDWDLAFESAGSGFKIKLNSAKAMYAYVTAQSTFSLVTDTSGFGANKKCDMPSGNTDSTAIGDWRLLKPVCIIDRGYNSTGVHQGFRKIQTIAVSATDYTVKISELNGSNELTVNVAKNTATNFSYFSFSSNTCVNIEPNKENYDLLFSQYTHVYNNPLSTYLVMGVLLNPNKVKAAQVFDKAFSEITISDTLDHPFYKAQNIIGFEWKTYDLQNAVYTVDASKCYIIKDTQGFFYKLHFIDFYNSFGLKGCPKWEYKKL